MLLEIKRTLDLGVHCSRKKSDKIYGYTKVKISEPQCTHDFLYVRRLVICGRGVSKIKEKVLYGRPYTKPLFTKNTNLLISKGQIISKAYYGILNSSKKQMNKFDFTTMIPQDDLFSFVFWRKLKTPKRLFEINWPLVNNQLNSSSNSTHHCGT